MFTFKKMDSSGSYSHHSEFYLVQVNTILILEISCSNWTVTLENLMGGGGCDITARQEVCVCVGLGPSGGGVSWCSVGTHGNVRKHPVLCLVLMMQDSKMKEDGKGEALWLLTSSQHAAVAVETAQTNVSSYRFSVSCVCDCNWGGIFTHPLRCVYDP